MSTSPIKTPFVSFCMSTYKRPDFLKKQLAVILGQTFTDFEIVISDNDPEASAEKIALSFNDDRIRYSVNKENLGMVKSFNNSLSNANGEYVVMITDDDPVYKDMLETLIGLSQKYPGYGVYQGGCEIFCHTPESAHVMHGKVGINSCLSSAMNYNEVRVYSAQEFPYLFFKGQLGSLLLWSVGIIKKNILIKHGGMPDYGSEFFTDHAYIVVNGSDSGVVFINKSLGYQDIHGENFGFNQLKNMQKYLATPKAFSDWVESKLIDREDWPALKKEMFEFVGRSIVEFSLFIKKSLVVSNESLSDFNRSRKIMFNKPFMKKWKFKYLMMSRFPLSFQYLLQLKNKFQK